MNDLHEYDGEEFNIVKFIYMNINASMKYALDLGTMVATDQQKLRAFKEQIKKNARTQWEEVGRALLFLGLADECQCKRGDYCTICSGSRFVMSPLISSSEYVDSGLVTSNLLSKDMEKVVHENLFNAVKNPVKPSTANWDEVSTVQ
jgi:hypothetical protein